LEPGKKGFAAATRKRLLDNKRSRTCPLQPTKDPLMSNVGSGR
jgi:hypothetical protein